MPAPVDRHVPVALGASSTASDVLRDRDLRGTVAVVTGGTTGLGEETARALAEAGATVAITARSAERARATLRRIRRCKSTADLHWQRLDLMSLSSVREAGDALVRRFPDIDLLIANAGIMAGPLRRSVDGFEAQLATNHFAHFVLTARLFSSLVAGRGGRVIVTASSAHAYEGVHLDDLNYDRRRYEGFAAYGQSKTANIMFAAELDRRYRALGVRSASVHPGSIQTDLGRDLTSEDRDFLDLVLERVERPSWKTVEQGAATQVWAAVAADPVLIGGRYLEDCGIAAVNSDNAGLGPGICPEAVEASTAAALWDRSEQLTGEWYPESRRP